MLIRQCPIQRQAWASYQIRKIAGCACAGNAGSVFPATLGQRSRHASRHVRNARAVMHAGIANWRFSLMSVAGKTFPGIPGACATRNCTYLVRGSCLNYIVTNNSMSNRRIDVENSDDCSLTEINYHLFLRSFTQVAVYVAMETFQP